MNYSQFKVLVTCIFLNKTPADRAARFIADFLQRYPNPQSIRDVPESDIRSYFNTLGLFRRASWIKNLAEQFVLDPPMPQIMRRKSGKDAGYASEVAHLAGVGNYASDAWRLFCKEEFYARHNIVVTDEWKRVQTKDKALQKYIDRKQREADLASQLTTLQMTKTKGKQEGITIGSDRYAMFVPKRLILVARDRGKKRGNESK